VEIIRRTTTVTTIQRILVDLGQSRLYKGSRCAQKCNEPHPEYSTCTSCGDGSHNAHGMRATVQSLRDRFPGQKFVFLLSIMADKDVDEMLALLLPLAGQFVTVAAHTPRAMPAETLAEQIRARGGRAEPAPTIEAGVARAVALGGTGPVCALGTLYFSGDVRKAFAKLNQ
jgi:dihydrofolate synthase/folylpolyglutamate synthase